MHEPCSRWASKSRSVEGRGYRHGAGVPSGRSPLRLRSSIGHFLLQLRRHHCLFQCCRVSPHQGTFREQSTWSRASTRPRERSVAASQEPLQRSVVLSERALFYTTCLDKRKLLFCSTCKHWSPERAAWPGIYRIAPAPLTVNGMKANGSNLFTWNPGLKWAPSILQQIGTRNLRGLAFSTSHMQEITSKRLQEFNTDRELCWVINQNRSLNSPAVFNNRFCRRGSFGKVQV